VNPSAVLGEAWALYKSQWRHLLPLAFVVFLLLSLLVLLLTVTLDWVGAVAGALVSIVGTFWLQGALVVAVQDVRDGRADLTIGETLSRVQPKVNKLTLAGLLAGIGILIGFLLFIVPGLILLTWWLFIVPVIMLEDAGIMESFGRSRELVRGNGWNVFGLIVMTILILIVAQIVLSLILSPLDDEVQGYVGSLISNTLLTPFVAAAWTIGYFHLRDVESAAAAAVAPSEPV
jgi:hypothetical protein